jgi:hypothetical protein
MVFKYFSTSFFQYIFADVIATSASIMTHICSELDEVIAVFLMVILIFLCFRDDHCLRLEILFRYAVNFRLPEADLK